MNKRFSLTKGNEINYPTEMENEFSTFRVQQLIGTLVEHIQLRISMLHVEIS